MQKSVLVEIVRSLNRKEIREVQKWLQSPAHNQRHDVVRLFDFLVRHPDADEQALGKEAVWKVIFPGEPFDDARMRQTMYFLLKSLEEYLSFIELAADEVKVNLALASVFRRRQLERPFRQTIDLVRKQMKEFPYRNSRYLQDQYLSEQENYNYLSGLKRGIRLNLQETSDAFDLAYLSDKLRLACLMLSHQAVSENTHYDFGFLENVLTIVETNHHLLSYPAIAFYYFSYKSVTAKDTEPYYDRLEQLILEQGYLFPLNELREFYLLAINYCVGRGNAGKMEYVQRAFQLFKKGFDEEILLENKVVSRFSFHNAVGSAIRCREFDWAENFIDKYQGNLEEKHRKSIVHFNLSRLHFEKGDYNKAQTLLTQFEYDDMLFNIIAKTMLLKIYYEQSELDAFESLLESMRIYLQRKEALDATRKATYKNMVSVMKKLLHLNPYSKPQVQKFRELVATTNPLAERDWLLKQAQA